MKRFSLVVGLLCSLLFIACQSSPPPKLTSSQLVSQEGNSTVALVFYNDNNNDEDVSDIRPYCTGVWVDPTHILTAHHCVAGALEMAQAKQDKREKNRPACNEFAAALGLCSPHSVEHKVVKLKALPIHYIQWQETTQVKQEPSAWHLGQVVGWDDTHDLALVEAVGNAVPWHQTASLAEKTPALGANVHICGHPRGYYWTFLDGTVSGYRSLLNFHFKDNGPYMQVQSPIYFGNSGGGAFDDEGHLVGIADMLFGLPGQGLFVHLDSIRQFLGDQHLLPEILPDVPLPKIGVAPPEPDPVVVVPPAEADAGSDSGSSP